MSSPSRVPGIAAEPAEDVDALGALRAVVLVLDGSGLAARAVDHVGHAVERPRQRELLPSREAVRAEEVLENLCRRGRGKRGGGGGGGSVVSLCQGFIFTATQEGHQERDAPLAPGASRSPGWGRRGPQAARPSR